MRRTLTWAVAGVLSVTSLSVAQTPAPKAGKVTPRPLSSPYGSDEPAQELPATTASYPTRIQPVAAAPTTPALAPVPAQAASMPMQPMQGMPMQPMQYAAPMQPMQQMQPMQYAAPQGQVMQTQAYQPMPGQPVYQPMPQARPVQQLQAQEMAPLPSGAPAMQQMPSQIPGQQPIYSAPNQGVPMIGQQAPATGVYYTETTQQQAGGPCGPAGTYWLCPEYIGWTTKGSYVPPLATTSPNGTPRNAAGVLGANTTVLYGGDDINGDYNSGFRLRGGFWLDPCQFRGIEGSVFYLGQNSDSYSAASGGQPIIARPFFNVITGRNDSEITSFALTPGAAVAGQGSSLGSLDINSTSDFWGADANYRQNLYCDPNCRLDFLIGYRFLRLADSLTISESVTSTDPASTVPVNTTFQLFDSFNTTNEFNGGQVGLAGEIRNGRVYLGFSGKVALGATRETVEIAGNTRTTIPGTATTVAPGGLLTQPTNIGTYSRSEFAVVPEAGVNLGYQVSPNLRAYVGYNFLYWSKVVRASEQIDTNLNTSQFQGQPLTGPARPAFNFNSSDFWAQGVSVGVELRY